MADRSKYQFPINVVGCPRTGTTGLVQFAKMFKVPSRHEGSGLEKLTHARNTPLQILPYDPVQPPQLVLNWLRDIEEEGLDKYMCRDQFFFYVGWGRTLAMAAIEGKYPKVRFIILHRPVRQVANSWWWKEGGYRNTNKYGLNRVYARAAVLMNESLVVQVQIMKRRPLVLRSERYFEGKYIDLLFDIMGVKPTDNNRRRAEKYLSTHKVNGKGRYPLQLIDGELIDRDWRATDKLEELCETNWYTGGGAK